MPVPSPSHFVGNIEIQGIANGSSKIPDSPESTGFFDAIKKTQEKTALAESRKSPAAMLPLQDFLNTGAIVLPPSPSLPPIFENYLSDMALRVVSRMTYEAR